MRLPFATQYVHVEALGQLLALASLVIVILSAFTGGSLHILKPGEGRFIAVHIYANVRA